MRQTSVELVPKFLIALINSIFELEKKLKMAGQGDSYSRNIEKIRDILADNKLFYEDPLGEPFHETRVDLEATISGTKTDSLYVVEVIKPVVRFGDSDFSKVIQKAIVVVQSKQEESC